MNELFVNEQQKMARTIIEDKQVLTTSLHTVLAIHVLFKRHKCDWMAETLGRYNSKIMTEFYVATVHSTMPP